MKQTEQEEENPWKVSDSLPTSQALAKARTCEYPKAFSAYFPLPLDSPNNGVNFDTPHQGKHQKPQELIAFVEFNQERNHAYHQRTKY